MPEEQLTPKGLAIRNIRDLPDDADWEDVQECVNFVAGVHKALYELDEGKGVPHSRARDEFAAWLTSR